MSSYPHALPSVADCLALVFTYPFMFAPAIAICEKALVPKFFAPVVNETHGVWRRNTFRGVLVACTLAVSLVGARQLNNFVSLIGAFCCGEARAWDAGRPPARYCCILVPHTPAAPLAFVYPCAFHLVLMPEMGRLSKVRPSRFDERGCGCGLLKAALPAPTSFRRLPTWP